MQNRASPKKSRFSPQRKFVDVQSERERHCEAGAGAVDLAQLIHRHEVQRRFLRELQSTLGARYLAGFFVSE